MECFTATGSGNYRNYLIMEEPRAESITPAQMWSSRAWRDTQEPLSKIRAIWADIRFITARSGEMSTPIKDICHQHQSCLFAWFFFSSKGHCLKGSPLWERLHENSAEFFKPVTFRH